MRSAASTAPTAALRAIFVTSTPRSRAAATLPSTARRAIIVTSPPTSPVAFTAPRVADRATPGKSTPISAAALIVPRSASRATPPGSAPISCAAFTNSQNYAPGGRSRRHHHAESIFAYVLSGAVRSENYATGSVKIYKAGKSFFEPPGSTHLISENASATESASLWLCSSSIRERN